MHRVIALVAALLVLTACGAQPQEIEVSAQERVAAAAASTQGAGSAKMAMKTTMTGGPQALSMSGKGAIEFETRRADITMTLEGFGLGGAGDGSMRMLTDGDV